MDIVNRLVEILHGVEAYDERQVRRNFDVHSATFGKALTAAKDYLRESFGIEFGPEDGKPFHFVRCDEGRKVRRAIRKRKASERKLDRAISTMAAVDDTSLTERERALKEREEQNLSAMLLSTKRLMARRPRLGT